MAEAAITIKGLWKKYRRYASVSDGIKEVLHPLRKKYHREFWALKDVSFDVKKGEAVGIIGRNGSGKSTLLQILCGVLQPTRGEVGVRGRIAALLELGAGFSPEFTGRENIYMNGALTGFTKEQIDAKFDEIAGFAEIGDFIDQPVRTYSSGMFVRLAFACAINVAPDILIVDEALAVGDKAFQLKCSRKIEELRAGGITLLFVSHDAYSVKNLCDRALWMNEGKAFAFGDSIEVVDKYSDFANSFSSRAASQADADAYREIDPASRAEGKLPEITGVKILDKSGAASSKINMFEDLNILVEYEVLEEAGPLAVGFSIFDSSKNYIFATNTQLIDKDID